ncbi:MAG: hypothetical protein ACTSRA_11485, partial [Promethearchaeota archaeon]
EVFHSQTDNKTMMNLTRFYNKLVSVVTNKDGDIKWYRYNGKDSFDEFDQPGPVPDKKGFNILISDCVIDYEFYLDPNRPITSQLSSLFIEGFNSAWNDASLRFYKLKDKKIEDVVEHLIHSTGKTKFKLVFKAPIVNIGNSHLKYMEDPRILTRFKLVCQKKRSTGLDEGADAIKLSGQFKIMGLMSVLRGDITDISMLIEKLKDEILDDLLVKVSRAQLFYDGKSFNLVIPKTILIPYINTPLKLNIFIDETTEFSTFDDFPYKAENFPKFAKFQKADKELIKRQIKRGMMLLTVGHERTGSAMLFSLRDLVIQRAPELINQYNNALNLIKSAIKSKQD